MYMLISGEVEVCEKRMGEDVRLGFLSEGAFFGEAPVLGINGELGWRSGRERSAQLPISSACTSRATMSSHCASSIRS